MILTPQEIRAASISEGRKVREAIARLPQSRERDEFLAISEQLERFWAAAGEDFLNQWLELSLQLNEMDI